MTEQQSLFFLYLPTGKNADTYQRTKKIAPIHDLFYEMTYCNTDEVWPYNNSQHTLPEG